MVTTNETTTNWFTSTQITMSYLVESYNKQIILSVILLSLVALSGYVRGELLTGPHTMNLHVSITAAWCPWHWCISSVVKRNMAWLPGNIY